MKYKYTFLKNRLFYDEILIPYLDKMSKKGWNLVSVNSFFKFEKSPQVYKYQVDYNPLTDDYLETLDHLGYEHVCCMQDMHIYRNVNLDAEDLSSDEDVLCEAKLKMFKPWAIAMCILAAMIFYGCLQQKCVRSTLWQCRFRSICDRRGSSLSKYRLLKVLREKV